MAAFWASSPSWLKPGLEIFRMNRPPASSTMTFWSWWLPRLRMGPERPYRSARMVAARSRLRAGLGISIPANGLLN